jgi:hypothetical protein
MEFMGVSVSILALVCVLVLLFGMRGARKILGWGLGPNNTRRSWARRSCVGLAMLPPPFNLAAPKLLSDADVGLTSNNWWHSDPVVNQSPVPANSGPPAKTTLKIGSRSVQVDVVFSD